MRLIIKIFFLLLPALVWGQKKYTMNKYLDSLIRNSEYIESAIIISEPICEVKENNKLVYKFKIVANKRKHKDPLLGFPFPKDTINAQYTVLIDSLAKINVLKKGSVFVFFLKRDLKTLTGIIKPNKKTIKYLKTTCYYWTHDGLKALFHSKFVGHHKTYSPNPLKFRIKQHSYNFYENGNLSKEILYIYVFDGRRPISAMHRPGDKQKKHRDFVPKYFKSVIYFENGQPKEIIENRFSHKKFDRQIISTDTTRYDTTGKMIFKSHKNFDNEEIAK